MGIGSLHAPNEHDRGVGFGTRCANKHRRRPISNRGASCCSVAAHSSRRSTIARLRCRRRSNAGDDRALSSDRSEIAPVTVIPVLAAISASHAYRPLSPGQFVAVCRTNDATPQGRARAGGRRDRRTERQRRIRTDHAHASSACHDARSRRFDQIYVDNSYRSESAVCLKAITMMCLVGFSFVLFEPAPSAWSFPVRSEARGVLA